MAIISAIVYAFTTFAIFSAIGAAVLHVTGASQEVDFLGRWTDAFCLGARKMMRSFR